MWSLHVSRTRCWCVLWLTLPGVLASGADGLIRFVYVCLFVYVWVVVEVRDPVTPVGAATGLGEMLTVGGIALGKGLDDCSAGVLVKPTGLGGLWQ